MGIKISWQLPPAEAFTTHGAERLLPVEISSKIYSPLSVYAMLYVDVDCDSERI